MLNKMQPANDLEGIYKSLVPGNFLDRNNERYYVSIYDQKVAEIQMELRLNENPMQTVYVSGQTGSGKTTALNFLGTPELREQFELFYLYGNEVFELNDLDIVDVLLLLGYKLVEGIKPLEKQFYEKLAQIQKQLAGEWQEEQEASRAHKADVGAEGKLGLSESPIAKFLSIFQLKAGFFADYRFNYDNRKVVRKAFTPKRDDLLDLVNDIIEGYLEQKKIKEKQLLVIFHELNHMQNTTAISKLFIKDRFYLEGIGAKKVVTVPVALVPMPLFPNDIFFFGIKLSANPFTVGGSTKAEQQLIASNKALLRQVLERRLGEAGKTLIDEQAVEYAIEQSGGNVRQFIAILHYAARKVLVVNGHTISRDDAELGAVEERRKLERSIQAEQKIRLLDFVAKNHTPRTEKDETFLECSLSNQIFLYENDKIWYDLNPLIKETVDIYAKRLPAAPHS